MGRRYSRPAVWIAVLVASLSLVLLIEGRAPGSGKAPEHAPAVAEAEVQGAVPVHINARTPASIVGAGGEPLDSAADPSGPTETSELEVRFPSGAAFRIRPRDRPTAPSIGAPPERLRDIHDDLSSRAAEGDAMAGIMLHRLLEQCKKAYADEQALEAAIDALRKDGVLTLADGTRPFPGVVNRATVAEMERDFLRAPYDFCDGTTEKQKQESQRWLDEAVEQGNYWALQEVATSLGSTSEGVAAWESLWRAGYFSALPALSVLYARGIDGGEPDYVRSFAYAYVQFKLVEAAYEGGRSDVSLQQVVTVEAAMRQSAGLLSPSDEEEGIRLAEQILGVSSSCCAGIG